MSMHNVVASGNGIVTPGYDSFPAGAATIFGPLTLTTTTIAPALEEAKGATYRASNPTGLALFPHDGTPPKCCSSTDERRDRR